MALTAPPPPQPWAKQIVSETWHCIARVPRDLLLRDTIVGDPNSFAQMCSLSYASRESPSERSTKTEVVNRPLPNIPTADSGENVPDVESTGATVDNFRKGLELLTDDRTCEEYYQRLGWSTGPFARQPARKQTRQFWVSKGAAGARWLAKRLATESHVDVLEAVASLLADFGEKSVSPIVHELDDKPTRDQAEVLLKALGWIEAPSNATAISRELVQRILEKYTADKDADVRAAAYSATRLLPDDAAAELLTRRRAVEFDPDARDAINEALSGRD